MGRDLNLRRKQEKLANPLGLVCAGVALTGWLEPVQARWLSPSWPFLAAGGSAVLVLAWAASGKLAQLQEWTIRWWPEGKKVG